MPSATDQRRGWGGAGSWLPARGPNDDVAAPLAGRPVERPLTPTRSGDWLLIDTVAPRPAYVDEPARAAELSGLARSGRRLAWPVRPIPALVPDGSPTARSTGSLRFGAVGIQPWTLRGSGLFSTRPGFTRASGVARGRAADQRAQGPGPGRTRGRGSGSVGYRDSGRSRHGARLAFEGAATARAG